MAALTPLGELLEQARETRGLSKREAARRAKISEGRWRQVVTGYQRAADVEVPVRPRASTVMGMARAVGVNVNDALQAAGLPASHTADDEPAAVHDTAGANEGVERLIEDIYADRAMPDERKHALVRIIRQAEGELRAVRDELSRWRRAG